MAKKKRVRDKLYIVKRYEPVAVPEIIVQYRIQMYSTHENINHPDNTIKFKVDIWVTTGEMSSSTYRSRKVISHFIPRCDVNMETGELSKSFTDGDKIIKEVFNYTNTNVVMEEIVNILTGVRKESK